MLRIIEKRKYVYVFSSILILFAIAALSTWGLNLGIDFKGGTLMEVEFSEEDNGSEESSEILNFVAPSREDIQEKLRDLGANSLTIQSSEESRIILRYVASDENLNEQVIEKLEEFEGDVNLIRVDFIGASVSNQLKKNAFTALTAAILGIALYIAWSFRKISFPIPSWQYGLGAITALAHDIIITLGIFAVLGKFLNIEIGVPFVAALLTILGYSVNDTIVVYDRIRENLMKSDSKESFENIINKSLNETLARSINTSLTVVIVLIAIIIFGGESIKFFSVALMIGVIFGTYSSIFVASSLLVSSYNYKLNKSKNL
ncbi:MAG: protein translocase subunit SecF [Candidatus Moranbacteria bacterium]|nr:protein translocase subunit SecF [Candidatus Moranbacteria bacterium]